MAPLDPAIAYGPDDLVVSTDRMLGGGRIEGPVDLLPARELVYRVVRDRGPLSLADLTRELSGVLPGGGRPPYDERPEAYVLRMVGGGRLDLPPLASLGEMVRALATLPPDPDYGLEVTSA